MVLFIIVYNIEFTNTEEENIYVNVIKREISSIYERRQCHIPDGLRSRIFGIVGTVFLVTFVLLSLVNSSLLLLEVVQGTGIE